MAKRPRTMAEEERLKLFAQRLNKLMLQKGWTGAELAREASKHAPQRKELGRHLISSYLRGSSEPTGANLQYVAKALGVRTDDLLPPLPGMGESPQFATVTSGLDGKTRLVVDAEIDAETALKVLTLVREATAKATKRGAA